MDDDRSKRIVKMLVLSWVFMMILIGALAFLLYLSFGRARNAIDLTNQKLTALQAIKPIAGADGLSIVGPAGPRGEKGDPGKDGKDSMSTTTIMQQAIPGPQGEQGKQGPIGPQGTTGKAAREIELRNNPETGDAEWRYTGDDEWTLLIKAPL